MDLRALRNNYQVKRQNLEKRKSRDFVKLMTAKKNSRLTTEISSFQTKAYDSKSRDLCFSRYVNLEIQGS
jgi:hypothetical protein